VFREQLREHGGGGLVERASSGNAEHGRGLPLRRERLALEDGKIRDCIVHSLDRGGGFRVVLGLVHRFAVVLLGQVVDDLEDGGLNLLGLPALERAPRDIVLREL
jgi:hypothetical protein